MNINELKDIFRKHGIHLTKERGQNLLVDVNVLSRISDITVNNKDIYVFEIGAGTGNWTDYLAQRAHKVYALEIDRKVFSILGQRVEAIPNIEPIHGDILRFDLKGFFESHSQEDFVIAGNLPYSLSSPILFRLIDLSRTQPRSFPSGFFMVQWEVAQRMTAPAGDPHYGRLGVMLAYSCQVRIHRKVPRGCFYPVPRVDSAFVSLEFGRGVRQRPSDDPLFEQVVRAAFGQRRKQLRNSLAGVSVEGKSPGREGWEKVFEAAKVEGSLRAGAVSPEAFLRLTQALDSFKSSIGV